MQRKGRKEGRNFREDVGWRDWWSRKTRYSLGRTHLTYSSLPRKPDRDKEHKFKEKVGRKEGRKIRKRKRGGDAMFVWQEGRKCRERKYNCEDTTRGVKRKRERDPSSFMSRKVRAGDSSSRWQMLLPSHSLLWDWNERNKLARGHYVF